MGALHFEGDMDITKLEAGFKKIEDRITAVENLVSGMPSPAPSIPDAVIGSYTQLSAKATELAQKMNAIDPKSSQWDEYNEELKKVQKNIEELPQPGKTVNPAALGSMNQLSAKAKELQEKMDNINPNSSEWKSYQKELEETRADMDKISGSAEKTEGALSGLKGLIGGAFCQTGRAT